MPLYSNQQPITFGVDLFGIVPLFIEERLTAHRCHQFLRENVGPLSNPKSSVLHKGVSYRPILRTTYWQKRTCCMASQSARFNKNGSLLSSKDAIKEIIQAVFHNVNFNVIRDASVSFESRLNFCVEQNSGHFEYLIRQFSCYLSTFIMICS